MVRREEAAEVMARARAGERSVSSSPYQFSQGGSMPSEVISSGSSRAYSMNTRSKNQSIFSGRP